MSSSARKAKQNALSKLKIGRIKTRSGASEINSSSDESLDVTGSCGDEETGNSGDEETSSYNEEKDSHDTGSDESNDSGKDETTEMCSHDENEETDSNGDDDVPQNTPAKSKDVMYLKKGTLIKTPKSKDVSMTDRIGGDILFTELTSMYPCRDDLISTLLAYMGDPTDWILPALYIHGHPGTGKTSVIKSLMEMAKVPFSYVDLLECHSMNILFELILNQLSGVHPSYDNNYVGYARCENMYKFLKFFNQIVNERDITQSVYIVLDKADILIDFEEKTILQAMLKLAELTKLNLCVILISHLPWEEVLLSIFPLRQPNLLYFNQYSKNEIIEILLKSHPSEHPLPFYKTYLTHVLNMTYDITRNLNDIKYISKMLFPLYCEPINSGKVSYTDSKKLWNHIEPHFKDLVTPLLLRDYTCEKFLFNRQAEPSLRFHGADTIAQQFDKMPYQIKFLLIASYLASYNPSNSDKRFFSKRKQTKGRKRTNITKQEFNQQLLGPKPFPLERLMAIFHSITERLIVPTQHLYCQVTTLVNLKYLVKVSKSDSLDAVKYKCLVDFDYIKNLSRSVDFEIVRYLQDYN